MKLSSFIRDNLEEILMEWDAFARTLEPAASGMSEPAIRDDAKRVLLSIVQDIDTEQSASQQIEKSKGRAPGEPDTQSPASEHGVQRRLSGFSLVQLAAEYRALRATVIRLWMVNPSNPTGTITNDIVRFNETIDQALAESIRTYTEHAARTRDTFLAILGHDLRSPLATMSMASDLLVRTSDNNIERTIALGARVKRGVVSMSTMVNDLLEFARTQLGGEIPIVPKLADLREVCQWAIDDASAVHPDCMFKLEVCGELEFYFDTARMQQVFSNLLNNAAQFHTGDQPIKISASSEAEIVTVKVKNFGKVIPPESLNVIFNPLVQLLVEDDQNGRPSTSMGLGLFIAREITNAHGGTIAVTSTEIAGTVFTVSIPRSFVSDQPSHLFSGFRTA